MKTVATLLVLGIGSLASVASAETTVSESLHSAKGEEVTIRRGSIQNQNEFEVISDQVDLTGEPKSSPIEARSSWKTACDDWKKETKEINRENSVISIACGTPKKEAGEVVGTYLYGSKASLKVKVRVRGSGK